MERVVVVAGAAGGGRWQRVDAAGVPTSDARPAADLAATIAALEAAEHPLWIWPDTTRIYPDVLRAGTRVDRARDLAMTEAVLEGYAGRWGSPRSLGAAWLRARGEQPPDDAAPELPEGAELTQEALFAEQDRSSLPPEVDPLAAAVAVYAEQRRRIAAAGPDERVYEPAPVTPARLDLLAATDSAAALVGVEMGRTGVPWDSEVHDRLLVDALGPRPHRGERPRELQRLAERIAERLDAPGLNPDSPLALTAALRRAGIEIESTRKWELSKVEHPAMEPLLRYKELARLWTATGWAWRDAWVRRGRLRPEYVPAGVVSGRWATRGGGALQIPRSLRAAVRADPGFSLVVADAGQLEPRILAAVSGDPGMMRAAAAPDLYAQLAAESFDGDRRLAKIGLLAAMYGGSSPALQTLRNRYPVALDLLETAARTGEAGGLVRTLLGRTCPPGSPSVDVRRARDRGRFTRNFVIQGSAADWANALLAFLRHDLAAIDGSPELVFFQHDEVIVHAPSAAAGAVVAAVGSAAARASRLMFGTTAVKIPLEATVAADYAAAKPSV
ncbi:MAG: bifunctional 3'-5' exonuclease/DNA polymerase [Mycobacteriales bacterium]